MLLPNARPAANRYAPPRERTAAGRRRRGRNRPTFAGAGDRLLSPGLRSGSGPRALRCGAVLQLSPSSRQTRRGRTQAGTAPTLSGCRRTVRQRPPAGRHLPSGSGNVCDGIFRGCFRGHRHYARASHSFSGNLSGAPSTRRQRQGADQRLDLGLGFNQLQSRKAPCPAERL